MAYHIYDTEAFVLNERAEGEANKVFFLLTPELGLIAARAQGVRWLKSKLRFQIAKFSRVRASLVRGKESWRLIGAEQVGDLENIMANSRKRELIAKIFTFLYRYIQGEGEQAALFDDLSRAINFLKELDPLGRDADALRGWELCVVIRSLNYLGYVKSEPKLSPVITFKKWETPVLMEALAREAEIVAAAEAARTASHL
jgi:recombinational DNA repair protein (RecF pathway)